MTGPDRGCGPPGPRGSTVWILKGELTYLAKPVDGLPEGDRLGLEERDAPGPEVGCHLTGHVPPSPTFEPRLFAERLDDLFKGMHP